MKTTLLLGSLLLIAAVPTPAEDKDKDKAAAPAEKAEELPIENQLLEQALTNMSRLKGYHVEAVITTPAGKAKLSGDLGAGSISLTGKDLKGVVKQRIVVEKKFYLSTDGGKSWLTGEDAEQPITVLFSNLMTAPVEPHEELWQKGKFTSKEETVAGEKLLHISKPAVGKEAASDWWLCKEPDFAKDLEQPIFIRKASLIVAADDGEFPITITYTKLSTPVKISAPTVDK